MHTLPPIDLAEGPVTYPSLDVDPEEDNRPNDARMNAIRPQCRFAGMFVQQTIGLTVATMGDVTALANECMVKVGWHIDYNLFRSIRKSATDDWRLSTRRLNGCYPALNRRCRILVGPRPFVDRQTSTATPQAGEPPKAMFIADENFVTDNLLQSAPWRGKRV